MFLLLVLLTDNAGQAMHSLSVVLTLMIICSMLVNNVDHQLSIIKERQLLNVTFLRIFFLKNVKFTLLYTKLFLELIFISINIITQISLELHAGADTSK